ncbi:MAG: MBL fold metallo-hydrolase [Chitinophagaceae bacterium]|nr:MBL fold metallo-hydrolase [Chitinophagaceae bacterium]
MTIHSIDTGMFKLDGGAMFGVVPKSIWNKLNPADNNNLCSWALRCLLIEDNGRLILIDNGIGDKQDEKFFRHYYLHGDATLATSLQAKGFYADDITDVVLTHLHFDHCGGSITKTGDNLVPVFRNAKYWCSKDHWEWAVTPNAREKASFLKENILPIQESGQLNFIEREKRGISTGKMDRKDSGIIPSLSYYFADGHTESMLLPKISYKDRTIIFMADLLPSIAHLPIPYVMAYDMFPLTSLNEKKAFLEEAIEEDAILFFEHDPVNECCTLERTEKGIRQKDIFKLSEI